MVEAELERLEESGVIKSIAFSEWASPIVSVVKSDGKSVRVCADFKQTLNPVTDMAHYLYLHLKIFLQHLLLVSRFLRSTSLYGY